MNRKDNNPRPPSEVESSSGAFEPPPPPDLSSEAPTAHDGSDTPPPFPDVGGDDRRIGETLVGRYRLDKLIGRGGMGRVYRATQLPLNRPVAVKILNPEFQRKDPQFVRRFFLEAATAARLTHPNTITVFDYGESERGELFIAMEYLAGRPLSLVLAAEGAIETARTLRVATQVCRALREAHAKGIIHRDLKPGNIVLMSEGDDPDFVKVLDFGLVKVFATTETPSPEVEPLTPEPIDGELTRAGMFLGSPKYMSPEQIQGIGLDPRTDIYSLGVVMYQMVMGRAPFSGSTSVEVIYKHVNDPPPPFGADVPPELQAIILRCLAKRRDDRYASMAGLLVHLKDAIRLLVPSTESGEHEVDIGLHDLTNSLLTHGGIEGRSISRPPPEGSRVSVSPPSGRARASVPPPGRAPASVSPPSPEGPRGSVSPPPPSSRSRPMTALAPDDPTPVRETRALPKIVPRPRRSWVAASWLAALLFSLVAAGAVALAWTGALERPRAGRPDVRLAGSEAVPAGQAAVHLGSEPSGADVYEKGEHLGRTPLVHRVAMVPGGATREFLFVREGWAPVVQQVQINRATVRVTVALPPLSRAIVPPEEN